MKADTDTIERRSRFDEVLDENERVTRRHEYVLLFREMLTDYVCPREDQPSELEWLTAYVLASELWCLGRQTGRLARDEEIRTLGAAEARRKALAEATERAAIRGQHCNSALEALDWLDRWRARREGALETKPLTFPKAVAG